jgi:hypothetical protein
MDAPQGFFHGPATAACAAPSSRCPASTRRARVDSPQSGGHVGGDLARARAEYQVRRDTPVRHCGFDTFHQVRRDGRWKLLNIGDTFQQAGCGPAWPR